MTGRRSVYRTRRNLYRTASLLGGVSAAQRGPGAFLGWLVRREVLSTAAKTGRRRPHR